VACLGCGREESLAFPAEFVAFDDDRVSEREFYYRAELDQPCSGCGRRQRIEISLSLTDERLTEARARSLTWDRTQLLGARIAGTLRLVQGSAERVGGIRIGVVSAFLRDGSPEARLAILGERTGVEWQQVVTLGTLLVTRAGLFEIEAIEPSSASSRGVVRLAPATEQRG
jgi:hypothetical protein